MTTTEQILEILEDTKLLLQKAQINLKKCPKSRLTKGYIETRLQCIDEYWLNYKKVHQDLVKSVPKERKGDISYFTNDEYFVFEDLYLNVKADLKDLLESLQRPTVESNFATGNSSVSNDCPVKLPRIQLPVFSGVYEEWPAFQDLFMSLVHNNTTLSNVQRLHYLKGSLSGEAEALLRHIQITEDNYQQCWTTLKNRYANRRLIVNSLLKRLFSQRKIPTPTANHIKALLDTTSECINSLKNLNLSTDYWDPLLIYIVVQKLDTETHREWEHYAFQDNSENLPTWGELSKFLQTKFRTLELISPPGEKTTRSREYAVHTTTTSNTKIRSCPMCKEVHALCHCREFGKLSPTDRVEYAQKNNYCFNCLVPGHSVKKCHVIMSCRLCQRRHHTLLHQSMQNTSSNSHDDGIQTHHNDVQVQEECDEQSNVDFLSHFAAGTPTALLATALVPVRNELGHTTVLRALIDHGSQATFVSERAAQLLRLKRIPVTGTITGVGSNKTKIKHAAHIQLLSRHNSSFNTKIKAYIMPTQLTSQLPSRKIYYGKWSHIQGLPLADPSFNLPGRVDMLLGVDVCAIVMMSEVIRGPPGTPCAQNTCLGWILSGTVQEQTQKDEVVALHHKLELNDMLKRMWEQDKEEKKLFTADEIKCEEIYKTTTTRTAEGRHVVKLPTKSDTLLSLHGDTRNIALQRLQQLERRFDKNEKLRNEYVNVMKEYKDLNHMIEVQPDEISKPAVYLPHHAVVREEKETSKVRIVFNASQKGSNNVSLNDELLIGPPLQEDMRSLIMRWRLKRICFTADIQKMYRAILVTEKDRNLQRILWRDNKNEPIKDYALTRVTFGTASAPYLAVRTLHQVAEDESLLENDDAMKIIREDFYMDDLMSGIMMLNSLKNLNRLFEALVLMSTLH